MKGFHHIALKVRDFDRAFAFYTKGLGFELSMEWGSGDGRAAMLKAGEGCVLELFAGGSDAPTEGALIHFALVSDNVDEDLAKAVAAGAEVTIPPTDVDIPCEPVKPVRIAFCKAPCGETIEFFQER